MTEENAQYRIRTAAFAQGIFAVPNVVADECLRLTGGLSLKALLWLLRHGGAQNAEAIATALRQPKGEIIDALQFWQEKGILEHTGDTSVVATQIPAPPPKSAHPAVETTTVTPPPAPPLRPASAQVADRLEESPALRWLFREEAPRILERTVGFDGQSTLLMLHDTYGLPPEVIPMLLQYCVAAGKRSWGYIEAVGQDWGKKEIDSIEKADAQITALQQSQQLWEELRRMAGLQAPKPTAGQTEYLNRWRREFGYKADVIHAAYEEMSEHTGKLSFAYMHKVLQSWHSAGIKTPADIATFKEQRVKAVENGAAGQGAAPQRRSAPKKPIAEGFARSYDLDAYERNAWQVPTFALTEGKTNK
ncbi:MAG: DnaD domain protein [Oscillospiraceae bacterium]|jgi:DnaD/phage-associated family protein|nr:DnaD domain protein [Oscillospiraceae bacterium]